MESTGNVVGFRAGGKLSRADYRDVLGPRIQSMVDQFQMVKVLFEMDASFSGWSLGAAWDNTTLVLKHRRHLAKVAMVGAPKWEEWCVKVPASMLVKGELRTFRHDRLTDAWCWLRT